MYYLVNCVTDKRVLSSFAYSCGKQTFGGIFYKAKCTTHCDMARPDDCATATLRQITIVNGAFASAVNDTLTLAEESGDGQDSELSLVTAMLVTASNQSFV